MKKRWLLALFVLLPLVTSSTAKADDVRVRWDIANFANGGTFIGIYPGADLSQCVEASYPLITLTGSGTFKLNGNGKGSTTGGGNWTIAPYAGSPGSSGTYTVTELISVDVGPGSLAHRGIPTISVT